MYITQSQFANEDRFRMKQISKMKYRPIFPILSTHKDFINGLTETDQEEAFWLTSASVQPITNYSTNPSQVLFDVSEIPKNAILLHTHHRNDSVSLTDKDIQTSQELKLPVAVWHTSAQKLDYYDPGFPHPYPLKIKSRILGWQDFLTLPGSTYRCNCYTLSANIAKALFDIDYPPLNFYNVNHITAFKDPTKVGFKEVSGEPVEGDLAILYISPEIPFHLAEVFLVDPIKKEPLSIHVIGGKHRSELLNLGKWKKQLISCWRVNPV